MKRKIKISMTCSLRSSSDGDPETIQTDSNSLAILSTKELLDGK